MSRGTKLLGTWSTASLVAAAVASIAVALGVLSAVGGPSPPWASSYRVALVVSDAHGLVEDADVLVRGVPVGSVEEVAVEAEATRVVLSLDPSVAPLRGDTVVRVGTKTLLEEAFVDLSPGRRGAPLDSGAELPARQVRDTVELDEALAPLAESGESARGLLGSLERGLRSPSAGERLNLTVAELRRLVGEVRTLADTLEGQERTLAAGMDDVRAVLAELADREASVRQVVAGGTTTLDTVSQRADALDATARELPIVLDAARGTVRAARPLVNESRPVVSDLRRAAPELSPAVSELGPVSADASALLAALPRLERSGIPFLAQAGRAVAALRPVARELSPALANLVPVVRHLAPRRRGLAALFAHGADLTGGRRGRGPAARAFSVDERGTAGGRPGEFANNAYPPPGDARDPRPYEPGSYPRLRPLFVP